MKPRTAIAISILILSLAAAAYWLLVRAPGAATRELAQQIRAEVAKTFHFEPEIRIHSRTYLGQNARILELATAKRDIWENRRLEHEWLGSMKRFEVEGRFTARAGYDLQQPLSFEIEESARRIRVTVPPAKLLGLELAQIRVLKDESGWWNQLTAKDREDALAELQQTAREKILASDLLAEAAANLERSLREIVTRSAPGFAIELAQPVNP